MNSARRTLGIDYGMKRIGVALSDERKILASPLTTLEAARKTEQSAQVLANAISQWETERNCLIDEIIIGLPLQMSGKAGLMADEVLAFVNFLKEKVSANIITWDERLSTVQAERALKESSLSRKRRSKIIDQNTAVVILQNYLDSKGNSFF